MRLAIFWMVSDDKLKFSSASAHNGRLDVQVCSGGVAKEEITLSSIKSTNRPKRPFISFSESLISSRVFGDEKVPP